MPSCPSCQSVKVRRKQRSKARFSLNPNHRFYQGWGCECQSLFWYQIERFPNVPSQPDIFSYATEAEYNVGKPTQLSPRPKLKTRYHTTASEYTRRVSRGADQLPKNRLEV